MSSCPTVEEVTSWQVGCLRAWWVGAECRKKVKQIMFIGRCFILFSVLVLSTLLNLIRRWRFEYWNAITIIFKFWRRSLWNFFRNLFYDCFTSKNEIKNDLRWKWTSFWRSAWKYLAFDTRIAEVCGFFFLKMRGFLEFSSSNTVKQYSIFCRRMRRPKFLILLLGWWCAHSRKLKARCLQLAS